MKRHGTIVGVPFDTRPPTLTRIRHTYWSAENPSLFPPKVNGLGWGLNFYWLVHPLRWLKARKASSVSTPHEEIMQ
jgi:hypothetical protein